MRRFFKKAGVAALALCVAGLLWGFAIEPRFVEQVRQDVAIPGLSREWDGAKIAFFADLQVGMWLANTDAIRRAVSQTVALYPALVLIGGDFVYNPTEDERENVKSDELKDVDENIAAVAALVRPLTAAGIPVYAVLGNHDYGMMKTDPLKNELVAGRVKKSLARIGVHILQNEWVDVRGLRVVGIGSRFAKNDQVEAALRGLAEKTPRVVLMHHPDSFSRIPANAAPLALAGHTHGDQIRIPFLPHWSWLSLVRDGKVHEDGWIQGFGAKGNRLYVNRGIGFSRVPIRINCPPELTIFTLHRAEERRAAHYRKGAVFSGGYPSTRATPLRSGAASCNPGAEASLNRPPSQGAGEGAGPHRKPGPVTVKS